MKNDKSQFVVGTSDFYLSLVICHWSFVIGPKNPCLVAKDFRLSSTHLCSSVVALMASWSGRNSLDGNELRALSLPLLSRPGGNRRLSPYWTKNSRYYTGCAVPC